MYDHQDSPTQALDTAGAEFFIINHDGFGIMQDELHDMDLAVYDEATALKNPTTNRFRQFYFWVTQHNPWLWLKLQYEVPDLITVDIKMPGMNGIEFLNQVKEQRKDLPVILCSAYGSYKQDFRVWASDAYVVKSADLQELKLTIKEILNF